MYILIKLIYHLYSCANDIIADEIVRHETVLSLIHIWCFFDGVLWGVLWDLPHLLLNHWTDFNQTWHKYFTRWENQHRRGVFFDGVLWGLPHLLLNHWTDFNQTWHNCFTQRENQHRIGVFSIRSFGGGSFGVFHISS